MNNQQSAQPSREEKLVDALNANTDLIEAAQILCRMYLEPGERRIVTDKELVSSLISLFDGPEQREALGKALKALHA